MSLIFFIDVLPQMQKLPVEEERSLCRDCDGAFLIESTKMVLGLKPLDERYGIVLCQSHKGIKPK